MNDDLSEQLNPSSLSYAEQARLLTTGAGDGSATQPPEGRRSTKRRHRGSVRGLRLTGVCLPRVVDGDPELQRRVDQLVTAHRDRGHLAAHLNPLAPAPAARTELSPAALGITTEILSSAMVQMGQSTTSPCTWTLGAVIARLKRAYCDRIGIEFTHIEDSEVRRWLIDQFECGTTDEWLNETIRRRVLRDLVKAQFFEHFVRKRFVGSKTFSLEGADALIPMLSSLLDHGAEKGLEEAVIGIAHRGRLNVMANVLGNDLSQMFRELLDSNATDQIGGGDVKYHLGSRGTFRSHEDRQVDLALCFNPSHLEHINPIAMGRTRAKQERCAAPARESTICLLVHGDASVAAQGVVQESINLSRLDGYPRRRRRE